MAPASIEFSISYFRAMVIRGGTVVWALDDLTGGDFVDDVRGEFVDHCKWKLVYLIDNG